MLILPDLPAEILINPHLKFRDTYCHRRENMRGRHRFFNRNIRNKITAISKQPLVCTGQTSRLDHNVSERFSPGINGSITSLLSASFFSNLTVMVDVHADNAQKIMAAIVQLAPVDMEQVSGKSKPVIPNWAACSSSFSRRLLSVHIELLNIRRDIAWKKQASRYASASTGGVLRNGDTHADIKL